MSTISSMVRVTGWTAPRGGTRPGRVTSTRSASSRACVALGLQLGPAGGQLGLEGGPGLVDAAAQVAAGGLVEAAEGALDLAEGRALGQMGLLGLAELLEVGGAGDGLPPGGDDGVQVWGWHGRAPHRNAR